MATKSARTGGLRRFLIAVVAVSVLGVTALSLAMSGGRRAAVTVDPRIPVGAARGYLLGRADAPVQVMEFGDFECPACGGFATLTEPDVRARLINTGIVAFRFFDFLIPDHQNSFTAHLAAACAGEQSMFWERVTHAYGILGTHTVSPKQILRKIGVGSIDTLTRETSLLAGVTPFRLHTALSEEDLMSIALRAAFPFGPNRYELILRLMLRKRC